VHWTKRHKIAAVWAVTALVFAALGIFPAVRSIWATDQWIAWLAIGYAWGYRHGPPGPKP
jgi:hypothetical protein